MATSKKPADQPAAEKDAAKLDETVAPDVAPSGVDEHGWEPTDYHRQAAEQGCAGDPPTE